jgi:hypothetical protein
MTIHRQQGDDPKMNPTSQSHRRRSTAELADAAFTSARRQTAKSMLEMLTTTQTPTLSNIKASRK